jgi:hypothetical protein
MRALAPGLRSAEQSDRTIGATVTVSKGRQPMRAIAFAQRLAGPQTISSMRTHWAALLAAESLLEHRFILEFDQL